MCEDAYGRLFLSYYSNGNYGVVNHKSRNLVHLNQADKRNKYNPQPSGREQMTRQLDTYEI